MPRTEEPLYQDEKLRVDYNPSTTEDHIVWVQEGDGEEMHYLIPRGILRDLAQAPRGALEEILLRFNSAIAHSVEAEGIGIDGLHVALCQAYAEEERRIHAYTDSMRTTPS